MCNFKVTSMSESIDAMKLRGACTRVPDHSLLPWDIVTDDVMEIVEEKPPERGKKYVVPENYLGTHILSYQTGISWVFLSGQLPSVSSVLLGHAPNALSRNCCRSPCHLGRPLYTPPGLSVACPSITGM